MDYKFAQALLTGRLTFGDENQIEARRLIAACSRWRDKLARCKVCHASGVILRGRPRRKALCYCLDGAPNDVLRALAIDVPLNDDAGNDKPGGKDR
jgi:hypothetical protein